MLWVLKLGITMLIHNKDDIEFVTEFPCFLGHPVVSTLFHLKTPQNRKKTIFQGCIVFRMIFDDMEKTEKLNIKCKPFSFFLR